MKNWWKSKTLWVGIAVVLLGGLEAAQAMTLPAGWSSLVGIAMVLLRGVTSAKLTS